MAGVVWLEFARVLALAPQYGVDWNAQPDARDPDARDARAAPARVSLATGVGGGDGARCRVLPRSSASFASRS